MGNKGGWRMKYIHVYGRDRTDNIDVNTEVRAYVDFKRITNFRVKRTFYQLTDQTKARMELVCDVIGGDRYVLAPYAVCNNNEEEIKALSDIIPYIIKTLTSSPEGTIVRCYTKDEKEWDVINETKEGF